jgi:membrane-associated phospholipid phosphatase
MTARRAAALAAAVAALAAGCGSGDDGSSSTRPEEPEAGGWKTWVVPSPEAVRVPPPPPEGSPAARRDERGLEAALRERSEVVVGLARRVERQPAVQPWLERAMEFVASREKDPPASSRNYALVAVAMHDAVVAAWHWKYRYNRPPPQADALFEPPADPAYPSEHAAVAGAAARVLAHLYPDESAARLEQEAGEIGQSRIDAGVARPSDVEAGLALGHEVADHVIAHARRDGFDREWNGSRPRGPGYWAPPPGSAARPVQPLAGTWHTWVLRSGDQFRPPPPPRFGTPGFERQVEAVMRAQEQLTAEQKRATRFWAGGEGTPLPAGIWIQVTLARLQGERLSTPAEARVLALVAVALADAGVAAWDAKYQYWYPRPQNGIRDSGADPDWKPYIPTPFFPAYVSGHSTYSAAAAEVLGHLFPDDRQTFQARSREAGLSRIWGGIHWPVDNVYGARMGRAIGRLVVEHARADGAEG